MAIFLYLVVGSLLKYHLFEARGVEVIPNIEFWRTLGSNLVDGAWFILRGCRRRDTGYEEI